MASLCVCEREWSLGSLQIGAALFALSKLDMKNSEVRFHLLDQGQPKESEQSKTCAGFVAWIEAILSIMPLPNACKHRYACGLTGLCTAFADFQGLRGFDHGSSLPNYG